MYRTKDGKLRFIMHSPNTPHGSERAKIFEVQEIAEDPYLSIKK